MISKSSIRFYKYAIISILILAHLIFMDIDTGKSYFYPDPIDPLGITTDKESYFLNENITVEAYWNIYIPEGENISVSILFLNFSIAPIQIPEIYSYSIYSEKCENKSGYNFHEFTLNSSYFKDKLNFPANLFVYIIIHDNPLDFPENGCYQILNHTSIYLLKFTPELENPLFSTNIIPFNHNYSIANKIIAEQDNQTLYPSNNITISLSYQSIVIRSFELETNNGIFTFNLTSDFLKHTGIYQLEIEANETDLFSYKKFESSIEVRDVNCFIHLVDNNFSLNYTTEFFFVKAYIMDEFEEIISSNLIKWDIEFETFLNISEILYDNEYFMIKIQNPKVSGEYSISIYGESENYVMNLTNQVINLDLNISESEESTSNLKFQENLKNSLIFTMPIIFFIGTTFYLKKKNKIGKNKTIPISSISIF